MTETQTEDETQPCANSECGSRVSALHPDTVRSKFGDFCSKKCRRRHTYIRMGGSEYGYELHIARRYGMTVEEYRQRVDAQHGRCAVCGDEPENGGRLHVDHNHESGAVRDLLCRPCNQALGLARDDPSRLRLMAAYLERHESKIL